MNLHYFKGADKPQTCNRDCPPGLYKDPKTQTCKAECEFVANDATSVCENCPESCLGNSCDKKGKCTKRNIIY